MCETEILDGNSRQPEWGPRGKASEVANQLVSWSASGRLGVSGIMQQRGWVRSIAGGKTMAKVCMPALLYLPTELT